MQQPAHLWATWQMQRLKWLMLNLKKILDKPGNFGEDFRIWFSLEATVYPHTFARFSIFLLTSYYNLLVSWTRWCVICICCHGITIDNISAALLLIFYLPLQKHSASNPAFGKAEVYFPHPAWYWAAVSLQVHYHRPDFVLIWALMICNYLRHCKSLSLCLDRLLPAGQKHWTYISGKWLTKGSITLVEYITILAFKKPSSDGISCNTAC